MLNDLAIRPAPLQEAFRQPSRAAGPDRAPGSAPPAPSPELGPPNPRLRMDWDLGMVVIEFRDTSGQVSSSLPTPRELEAYRAAVMYGSYLPSYVSPNNHTVETLLKAGPSIPPIDTAPPGPLAKFLGVDSATSSVDRVT